MIYSARYAHLKEKPNLSIGDVVAPGQASIATMGNSGQSSAAHVHFDIIPRVVPKRVYRLYDVGSFIRNITDVMQQHRFFLDDNFFGVPPHITTYFGDPGYLIRDEWKFHPGYDLVPEDRHETEEHYKINWNRSVYGKVSDVGFDERGYGHYLVVQYEVRD